MEPAEITTFPHARMTPAQFSQEMARIRSTYGGGLRGELAAKRDQALADLFHRSGWSQGEIASQIVKSQPWVSSHVLFGQFLDFISTDINSENFTKALTENRFSKLWALTGKKENANDRFRSVRDLLNAIPPNRPQIGNEIVAEFGDGNWHDVETIAAKLDTTTDHVEATFEGMLAKGGSYKSRAERKREGGKTVYRIFPLGHLINSNELIAKLSPIVKGLEVQGKKSMATMSPDTVADLARELQTLLNTWARSEDAAKDAAPSTTRKSPKR